MDRAPGLVSIGVSIYSAENYLVLALDEIRKSYKGLYTIISDIGSAHAAEPIRQHCTFIDPPANRHMERPSASFELEPLTRSSQRTTAVGLLRDDLNWSWQ